MNIINKVNIINIDDYRPKDQATIKAEYCVKTANDYSERLRNYGYPEVKISYMRHDFLWKLAKEIKGQKNTENLEKK